MTGWATGPHLHYEFKVDNVQQDPLKVALPNNVPLDSRNMAAFRSVSNDMMHRLNLLRNTNLARFD
jgi:murein DD-endopeptidase MepM/ murein hydrolase activator NlpD